MPAVRVRPKDPNATHHLSLSDGVRVWGIQLNQGALGIQEQSATPSNIRITGGGTKFGDYDPMMSHIEQDDWSGGRGQEFFVDDPTRYYDSWEAWTLTPGKLFQAPQWNLSSGYRGEDTYYPGSVTWKALVQDERYQSVMVTGSTTFSADKVYMWIRKVGSPGTLTLEHTSTGASNKPSSTANKTVTVGASAVDGPMSIWYPFDWTTTQAVSSAANYHIKVYGATTDGPANHWEIGVNDGVSTGTWTSSNGDIATWTAKNWKPYYRVVAADVNRKWHFVPFSAPTDFYAIPQNDDGSTGSDIWKCSTGTTVAWSSVAASGTAISGIVKSVAVFDKIAICARGSTVAPYEFQLDSSGGLQGRLDGSTAGAELVHTFYDPVDGAQVWKVMSTGIAYRAKTVTWSSNFTWTPSTGIPVGDKAQPIIGLGDYNDQMWFRKKDSMWSVKNDRAAKLNAGIGAVVENVSFLPLKAKDLFLYFSWSHSLEQLYGGTLSDVGPWKGSGMPSSRSGYISCLEPGVGVLFAGIDAGSTGLSAVLAYDTTGWHEIYRCQEVGRRVQNLKWQPVSGDRGRLWISVGGDLIYLLFPLNTMNPLRDPSFAYQHEFALTTSTIDMGASQLPKLFHEFHVITENLGTGKEVYCEYQLDDNIGSSTWTNVGGVNISPESSFRMNRGEKHAIRLRIRGVTNSNTVPTVVNATILEGVARTPVKRMWNIRAKTGTFQVNLNGAPDAKPDDFYLWFQNAAVTTTPLRMRSVWKAIDDIYVFAEPPSVSRTYTTPTGEWGADFGITVREI